MTTLATPEEIFSVEGKVALVTGASSGLGHRFARLLDAGGATVYAAARREDRLAALAETSRNVHAVRCDVTSEADLDHLVDRAMSEHGRIDVLVNNAGLIYQVPALDEEPERMRAVLEVNLLSVLLLTQRVARHMIAGQGGSIVNVTSIGAFVAAAPSTEATYIASKGGLVSATRELAVQWAGQGIRVNALAPGAIPTEMTPDLADEAVRRYIVRQTPVGRVGELGDLDGALLFLASGASRFMTGQTLVVDGGWTAR